MKKILSFVCILIMCCVSVPVSAETAELTPENTVIISNETDEAFCRDFSMIMKRVSIEWAILESEIPEHVKNKNLIVIGGPDAEYTGDLVKQVLSWREERYLRKKGQYAVFEKKNPWADTVVYVCAGSDRVFTKKAAEEKITSIIEGDDPEQWITHPISDWSPLEAKEDMVHFMVVPEDENLPREALVADFHSEPPEHISAHEAKEDIEHLFYLLSHGYSGYGYFNAQKDFDQVRTALLKEVDSRDLWAPRTLSEVIYNHLSFIHDGHIVIGFNRYFAHKNFWYADAELQKTNGNYSFISDNISWTVVTVNGEPPEAFVYPSLNAQGKPVYILGMLSHEPPGPLAVRAHHEGSDMSCEMQLHHASFDAQDIFGEDDYAGVPVVSIRSFSDVHSDELEQFMQTAQKYKGEPYLILDIRGNGGGNTTWPEKWVEQFTGHDPAEYFVSGELISKTTMMGMINALTLRLEMNPEIEVYSSLLQVCEAEVDTFEHVGVPPYWGASPVSYVQVIPTTTTVVVLTDGKVASAGEILISYLRQVDHVIFIGENTTGAFMFGDTTLHQLPHSKLTVYLPYRLFFPVDSEIEEEKGFSPDLWVPAPHALTYALEAIKTGTLAGKGTDTDTDTDQQPSAGSLCAVVVVTLVLYIFFTRKKR